MRALLKILNRLEIGGDSLPSRFVSRGFQALIIKLSTAALTFLMFVVLARFLDAREYGTYATIFSLATFFGYFILGGLHTFALRCIPSLEVQGRQDLSGRLIRDGYIAIGFLAMALAATTWTGGALLQGTVGAQAWFPFIAIALAAPLAFAEFQSNVLRGWGSVNRALIPRDVGWRVISIVAVGGLALAGVRLEAVPIFILTAAILLVLVVVQFGFGLRATPPEALAGAGEGLPRPGKLLTEARWLWVAALSGAIVPQLGVVLVSGLLSPIDAGVMFAAQRAAALLSLPLVAAEIIGGPMIAHAWARNDVHQIQRVCMLINTTLAIPVTVGAIAMTVLSDQILSTFRPEFSAYGFVLTILAMGTLVNALCGPTGFIMLMTGNEKKFVMIYSMSQLVGLSLIAATSFYWGILGAAFASTATVVIWNIIVAQWSRKNLGVDPTVMAFFYIPR